MTTTTYTEVWELVQRLPLDEQRRLNQEIAARVADRAESEAFLAQFDALGARISAAWQDDMSAADAVDEQRREL